MIRSIREGTKHINTIHKVVCVCHAALLRVDIAAWQCRQGLGRTSGCGGSTPPASRAASRSPSSAAAWPPGPQQVDPVTLAIHTRWRAESQAQHAHQGSQPAHTPRKGITRACRPSITRPFMSLQHYSHCWRVPLTVATQSGAGVSRSGTDTSIGADQPDQGADWWAITPSGGPPRPTQGC